MQINNRESLFYVSFVKILDGFFSQNGAQRITFFWASVPVDEFHSLQALFTWEIEMGDFAIKGGSCDCLWEEVPFNAPFWDVDSNVSLTSKINEILIEHIASAPNDNKSSFFGVNFTKDNWKDMLIALIGYSAIEKKEAEDRCKQILETMNSFTSTSNNFDDYDDCFVDKI